MVLFYLAFIYFFFRLCNFKIFLLWLFFSFCMYTIRVCLQQCQCALKCYAQYQLFPHSLITVWTLIPHLFNIFLYEVSFVSLEKTQPCKFMRVWRRDKKKILGKSLCFSFISKFSYKTSEGGKGRMCWGVVCAGRSWGLQV